MQQGVITDVIKELSRAKENLAKEIKRIDEALFQLHCIPIEEDYDMPNRLPKKKNGKKK